MNRTLLFFSLLLPVALFIGEQAFGSASGKQAAQTTLKSANQASPNLIPVIMGNTNELKIQALVRQIRAESVDFDHTLSRHNHFVPEDLTEWLDNEVLDVAKQLNPLSFDEISMFSRCASGYNYRLYRSETATPESKGILYASRGCDDQIIGQFTFDIEAKDLLFHFPNDLGTASIVEYLKLYEKANEEA